MDYEKLLKENGERILVAQQSITEMERRINEGLIELNRLQGERRLIVRLRAEAKATPDVPPASEIGTTGR